MTEQEWLSCSDPDPMLESLTGRMSDRKSRLFALACCNRLPGICAAARHQKVVDVLERFVDGHASMAELQTAQRSLPIYPASRDVGDSVLWGAAHEDSQVVLFAPEQCADHLAGGIAIVSGNREFLEEWGDAAYRAERAVQANLLRDIIHFLLPCVTLPYEWLVWNDGTVRRIAQAIYDDRAFDRMPILADALEDAGCDNADILNHCRSGGEHVRGCWVVDLLLGKE
jgi:hypothetical protein